MRLEASAGHEVIPGGRPSGKNKNNSPNIRKSLMYEINANTLVSGWWQTPGSLTEPNFPNKGLNDETRNVCARWEKFG